jgi:hypothetical protein
MQSYVEQSIKPRIRPWGSVVLVVLTTRHHISAKVGANFADKRRTFGRIVCLQTEDTEFYVEANAQNEWVCGLCQSQGILNNWKTHRFGNWTCFRLQIRGGIHLLCWVSGLTGSVVFSSYLEFRAMDKVLKPIDSECFTTSPEPFRIYMWRESSKNLHTLLSTR